MPVSAAVQFFQFYVTTLAVVAWRPQAVRTAWQPIKAWLEQVAVDIAFGLAFSLLLPLQHQSNKELPLLLLLLLLLEDDDEWCHVLPLFLKLWKL